MSPARSGESSGLLSAVPLFTSLPGELLDRLAGGARRVGVPAGALLFAQGDPGEELFVVRSGRLEVLVDGLVVREHGRGETIGELAALVGGERTATVRARRDSELLGVARGEVERLITADPRFTLALVRQLALRQRREHDGDGTRRVCRVLALVPMQDALPPAQVGDLAEMLVAHLATMVRVARVDADAEPAGWGARLDTAEAGHEVVLLVARHADGGWAAFCRRQADRTLALVDPRLGGPGGAARPPGCELVAPADTDLHPWLERLDPLARHVLDPRDPAADVARMARRVSGRALGLALSGGGARALAHIGVIDELARAGHVVDRVCGTSMGAVVAGMLAVGMEPAEMVRVAAAELAHRRLFRDYTWPRHGLIRGTRATQALDRIFGTARIEDQRRAMSAISVDLVAAEEVVHRRGRIAEVVGLSVRIPGIAPPYRVGERLHVDGGVLDNLPVEVLAADGEGPVVASDVMTPFDARPHTGPRDLPPIVDTLGRAMTLGSWQRAAAARRSATRTVTPTLDGIGMFDFPRHAEIVERGRRAARAALDGLDLGAVATAPSCRPERLATS